MSSIINLTGKKFGNLKVIKRVDNAVSENSKYTETKWLCVCDCGNQLTVRRSTLLRGKSNCGCVSKFRHSVHGMSHTRLHNIWLSMKCRCSSKGNSSYKDYGGRGISVCNEWNGKHGFEHFYKWAINNGYLENLTIDRIDVNGNYEPSNCRWADNNIQANNKQNTIYATYNGETMSLADMCKKYHVNYHTAYARYARGLDIEKVLFNRPWDSEISGNRRKVIKIDINTFKPIEIYDSGIDAARKNNIRNRNLIYRCCNGERKSTCGFKWIYADVADKLLGGE